MAMMRRLTVTLLLISAALALAALLDKPSERKARDSYFFSSKKLEFWKDGRGGRTLSKERNNTRTAAAITRTP
jgi:hypothetical protein